MQNLTVLWCIYMHRPVPIQIYSKVQIHADLQDTDSVWFCMEADMHGAMHHGIVYNCVAIDNS